MSNVAAGLGYIPAHGRSRRGTAGGSAAAARRPVQERADAARNRAKALAAAERLFAALWVAAVSMDDIAASAGVGKGTLYRRFGDKSGLAAALLDERESRFSSHAGRAASARPRGAARSPARRVRRCLPGVRRRSPGPGRDVADRQSGRAAAHRLPSVLVPALPDPALRGRGGRSGLRADAILAALTAEQVRHWRHTEGRSLPELAKRDHRDHPPARRCDEYRDRLLSRVAPGHENECSREDHGDVAAEHPDSGPGGERVMTADGGEDLAS